jgi:hypothetical protein
MLQALQRKRVEDIVRQIRSRASFVPHGTLNEADNETIVRVLAERIVELEARIAALESRDF